MDPKGVLPLGPGGEEAPKGVPAGPTAGRPSVDPPHAAAELSGGRLGVDAEPGVMAWAREGAPVRRALARARRPPVVPPPLPEAAVAARPGARSHRRPIAALCGVGSSRGAGMDDVEEALLPCLTRLGPLPRVAEPPVALFPCGPAPPPVGSATAAAAADAGARLCPLRRDSRARNDSPALVGV